MLAEGQAPDGSAVPLKIDANGALVVSGGTGGGGTGDASAANQATQIAAEQAIQASAASISTSSAATNTAAEAIQATLGAKADASATSDTGTFSIAALIKRCLENWTALQAKIPALSSGKIPVIGPLTDTELRATALPVSGPLTDTQLRASAVPILQTGPTATGTIAGNTSVELSLAGYASASIDVRGTLSATMTPEGTVDGTNWFTLNAASATGQALAFVTFVSNGSSYIVNTTGLSKIRVRASSFVSGSSVITMMANESGATVNAMLPPTTNMLGDIGLGVRTSTTNGLSRSKFQSLATTNANNVKSSAGRLYGWYLINNSASWRYVHIFNKSSAPTPGTDTSVNIIGIPPNGKSDVINPLGVPHTLGIGYSVTAGVDDTDTTAIGANEVVGAFYYA